METTIRDSADLSQLLEIGAPSSNRPQIKGGRTIELQLWGVDRSINE